MSQVSHGGLRESAAFAAGRAATFATFFGCKSGGAVSQTPFVANVACAHVNPHTTFGLIFLPVSTPVFQCIARASDICDMATLSTSKDPRPEGGDDPPVPDPVGGGDIGESPELPDSGVRKFETSRRHEIPPLPRDVEPGPARLAAWWRAMKAQVDQEENLEPSIIAQPPAALAARGAPYAAPP